MAELIAPSTATVPLGEATRIGEGQSVSAARGTRRVAVGMLAARQGYRAWRGKDRTGRSRLGPPGA